MSVDIVGSTAFKQSDSGGTEGNPATKEPPSEAWFSPIVQFYRQIELLFSQEWGAYQDKHADQYGWEVGSAPLFWKGVGDEVIYYKEITHHREAYCCVQCWKNVVNRYRRALVQKYPKLDLKASAWIAGFPVNNAEIIFRTSVGAAQESQNGSDSVYDNAKLLTEYYRNGPNGFLRDFIGPSIDTGFRISQFASPRKFVVSVDLALMLASAEGSRPYNFCYNPMKFYFDGSVVLKGVLSGIPYPIIWVDLLDEDKLEGAEDKLLRRENVDQAVLKVFCEEFLTKHSSRVSRPYIRDSADPLFSAMPARHQSRLDALREYIRSEEKKEVELGKSNDSANQRGAALESTDATELIRAIAAFVSTLKGPAQKTGDDE